jgi:methionyl-tRNA formyltransferase
LLPRHRGASPIQAAILAGDRETGISYMRIDAGLDTGPVYGQVPININPDETAGELETRLAEMATKHLEWAIQEIVAGKMAPLPQPPDGVTVARKIRKEAGRIDWNQPAETIARQVRAYNPWPRCDTTVPGGRRGPKRIQITAAEAVAPENDVQPGTVLTVADGDWVVACGLGALRILRVVPEGKSEMPAEDYLRGARIEPGTVLGASD